MAFRNHHKMIQIPVSEKTSPTSRHAITQEVLKPIKEELDIPIDTNEIKFA